MTTRAIHLELSYDLTSSAFINALRRFLARRGPVKRIYSDNRTNFVGAERILKLLKRILKHGISKGQVKDFRFTRHLWDMKSSPFIASYAIQKLLQDIVNGSSNLT